MKKSLIILIFLLLVGGGYSYWALSRPLPALRPAATTPVLSSQETQSSLKWPAYQSAVAIAGSDIVETHGEQVPRPTASTIKVLTALMVLEAKPLQPGEQGPSITLSQADVDSYTNYLARDGSVLPVQAGEELTQYQMLQALMLPSANNIADTLASWAYGSHQGYAEAAAKYLDKLGLKDTKVGSDASGLAPDSISTAHDLVILGQTAMKNPVLSQIAAQAEASGFPLVTTIRNVNGLLGTDGIVGIKTGNSDEAGGAFIGAARSLVNNKEVTIITAVLGAPMRAEAMRDSLELIRSAQANFSTVTVAKSGTAAGRYILPWGGSVTAATDSDLTATAWGGTSTSGELHRQSIPANSQAGSAVGEAVVPASGYNVRKAVPIKLEQSVPQPSAWWRLTHPSF